MLPIASTAVYATFNPSSVKPRNDLLLSLLSSRHYGTRRPGLCKGNATKVCGHWPGALLSYAPMPCSIENLSVAACRLQCLGHCDRQEHGHGESTKGLQEIFTMLRHAATSYGMLQAVGGATQFYKSGKTQNPAQKNPSPNTVQRCLRKYNNKTITSEFVHFVDINSFQMPLCRITHIDKVTG